MQEMRKYPFLYDINFKKSTSDFLPFDRLQVKIKDEIVVLQEDKQRISFCQSAKKLSPLEWHLFLEKKYTHNDTSIVILDSRNQYESRIGKFQDAVCPPVETTRQFREYFETNADLFKDKIVLMYCTGGVRCERLSVLLSDCVAPREVFHLENGIHAYCQQFPDGYFKGRNYVFDDRISIKITDDILTNCDLCRVPCDLYNNCLNAICNKHYICCDGCLRQFQNCCSVACQMLTDAGAVAKRPLLKSRSII
jgi:predicted sulfurtransferase